MTPETGNNMPETLVYEEPAAPGRTVSEKIMSILPMPDGLYFARRESNTFRVSRTDSDPVSFLRIRQGESEDFRILLHSAGVRLLPSGLFCGEEASLSEYTGCGSTCDGGFRRTKIDGDTDCYFPVPFSLDSEPFEKIVNYRHLLCAMTGVTGTDSLGIAFDGAVMTAVLKKKGAIVAVESLAVSDELFPLLTVVRLFQRFRLDERFAVEYYGEKNGSTEELRKRFPGFVLRKEDVYRLLIAQLL